MTDTAGTARVRPQPPNTIKYAAWSMGAQVVLTLITALLLQGYTSELSKLLVSANAKLKATDKSKKPVDTYLPGSSAVSHDLSDYRKNVVFHALLIGVLFALAAYAIWRGTGLARWLYIVTAILFPITGITAIAAEGPGLTNALSFVIAVLALAAIVLLLLPQSVRFFAAAKAVRTPALPAGGGPPTRPPGLRGLFAPAPPRPPRPAPTRSSRSAQPAGTRPASRPAGAAANADDDAVEATGRGKPKARTSPSTPAAADDSVTAPPRNRGKSRRV